MGAASAEAITILIANSGKLVGGCMGRGISSRQRHPGLDGIPGADLLLYGSMDLTIRHTNAVTALSDLRGRRPTPRTHVLTELGEIFRCKASDPEEPICRGCGVLVIAVSRPELKGKVDEFGWAEDGDVVVGYNIDYGCVQATINDVADQLSQGDWACLQGLKERAEHALFAKFAARRMQTLGALPGQMPAGFARPTKAVRDLLQGLHLAPVSGQISSKEDLARLVKRGVQIKLPVRRVAGRISQCHQNSLRYWALHPKTYKIVTGYTVDPEAGAWHQHTWLISKTHLLDTTPLRGLYFGFVMTDAEALVFYFSEFCDAGASMPAALQKYVREHGSEIQKVLPSLGPKA